MSLVLFADNASSTLASAIGAGDTNLSVAPGTGTLFSNPGAGQYALGTLEDVSGNIEVVKITSRTVDSFVIVRAQEGTTALAFASGTRFEQRVTMGMLQQFLQKNGGDTLSGTTNVTGVIQLGAGGSLQGGEVAGAHIRCQPGDTSNEIFIPVGGSALAAGSTILTTANLLTHLPSGIGVISTGMVLMWSGASSSVPSGYVVCDGTNGTPDLRDQFVIGAGGSLPTAGGSSSTTTGSSSISGLAIGGTALTLDQIPAHTHQYWASTQIDFGGSSGQPIQCVGDTGFGGGYVTNIPNGTRVPPNQQFIQYSGGSSQGTNSAANAHTHTVSGSTAHTHSYTLPPYRALFYIMKT